MWGKGKPLVHIGKIGNEFVRNALGERKNTRITSLWQEIGVHPLYHQALETMVVFRDHGYVWGEYIALPCMAGECSGAPIYIRNR